MTGAAASGERVRLRRLRTDELAPGEISTIRSLLDVAFGDDDENRFTDLDWAHGLGGTHFVLDVDGELVTHASVVEREIHVDGRPLRTGYVEAVATAPERQHAGYGSLVMAEVGAFIRERYELGVLGTGRHAFYHRQGWFTWNGPAFVRTAAGSRRTPDEEGFILVLSTPSSPVLDPSTSISCDWRPGDVW